MVDLIIGGVGFSVTDEPVYKQTSLYQHLQPEPVQVPGTGIVTDKPFVVKAESNARMWVAMMDVDKATAILEPYGLLPATVFGKALVAVTAFNYEDSPSGAYHEAVVTIVATEDSERQSIGLTDLDDLLVYFNNPKSLEKGELLTMPDTPYVFAATDLYLDKKEPIAVGRELMGLPKHFGHVSFISTEGSQSLSVDYQGDKKISSSGETKFQIPLLSFEWDTLFQRAEWMRFMVETRLEDATPETPNKNVPVVVNSCMGLDVYSLNDSLSFSGELADRYGDVTVVAGLIFSDLVAGFDYPYPQSE